MSLLRTAVSLARAEGWVPAHVDVTVIAERIRVAPHRNEIASRIADVLDIPPGVVSVKGTTTDGLGFTGEGGGLAAVAVVTVERRT
jgi:2-C-methyl-D-erythritol 4-phosphate cytidylyltransferase/2-C-methyl-D-erythritol 2,4-cyclodiphosphate synthase